MQRNTLTKLIACLLAAAALMLTGCARADAKELFEGGAAALEDGRYEDARVVFDEVIGKREFEAEAYRGIGLTYLSEVNYADACIAFERALLYADDKDADFIRDVNLYLAYCRSHHAQSDKALEIYDSMLKKGADPEVYFLRGKLFMEEGDEAAARADFDRAVSLSSDYDLYISIYQLYNARKKDADGADFLEMALEIAEQADDAYYNRGLVYYYLQNYNEARSQLAEALAADPEDTDALLLMGRVYLAMDDVADARALFKEHAGSGDGSSSSDDSDLIEAETVGEEPDEPSAEPSPVEAAAYNGLALCDMAEGLYESALNNVQKGLELAEGGTRQALLFNEIVIYENTQDWENARRKAAAYVSRYPSDEAGLRENEFLASR